MKDVLITIDGSQTYPDGERESAEFMTDGEYAFGRKGAAFTYMESPLTGLEGTKMSKSLGNLVFVHKLVEQGVDPSAIRLGLYAHHYRGDRDWSDELLNIAIERLNSWRSAFTNAQTAGAGVDEAQAQNAANKAVSQLRERLADDLDTVGALQVIDEWAQTPSTAQAAGVVATAVDGLLGVRIS